MVRKALKWCLPRNDSEQDNFFNLQSLYTLQKNDGLLALEEI